jgi:hypothetical protein
MYRYFSIRIFLPLLVLLIPSIGHACFIMNSGLIEERRVNLPNSTSVVFGGGAIAISPGAVCELTPVLADGTKGSVTIAGVTLNLSKTETPASATNVACPAGQIDPSTVRWPVQPITCGSFYKVTYKLEGTSTNTDPTATFPCPLKVKVTNRTTGTISIMNLTTSSNCLKVPVTPTPTCSATINPSNLTLSPISLSDLSGAVGSFTTKGQQSFQLSVTCPANSWSGFSNRLNPTFTFGNKFRASTFDIAIDDRTDLGFGFRLISPSTTPIRSGTPLTSSNDIYGFTTPTATQTVSKVFGVQYAKSRSTVTTGSISSTIVVTFTIQ